MSISETLLDITISGLAILPLQQFVEDVASQVNYQFIDEIFHYPQLKKIIRGDYTTWDPKITTPPGLYYLTALYSKLFNVECTLANMRYFNLIGGIYITILAILIRSKLSSPGFSSAAIFLNPLMTIFYSLYYTDIWASAMILTSLTIIVLRPMNNNYLTSALSAFFGLISLSFRQTNIMWCAFAATVLIDFICKDENQYKYEEGFEDFKTFVKTGFKNIVVLIPWILVGLAFIGFVYINGGVALGDKENHILVPHLAQLNYCVTFIALFTLPIWISVDSIISYFSDNFFNSKGLFFNAFWIPFLFNVIMNFTIIHPFVLADNRHFTFYIVKNFIIRTESSKFELIPIYHVSYYVIYKLFMENCNIDKTKNNNYKRTIASPNLLYSFFACTALSIVFSPLFEPRYYILPYIVFRIFVKPTDSPLLNFWIFKDYNLKIRYVGECLWLWFWTQAIYLIFLQFTFEWPDLPELQRVIW